MTREDTPDIVEPESDGATTTNPKPKIAPETLALRARPRPVARISRPVLIGSAAGGLILLAGLVLLALKPPAWKPAGAPELFSVDRKPVTDRLSGLPASYDGTGARTPSEPPKPAGVKPLQAPSSDPTADAETTRLARLATQAREAPVLFRLQLKSPGRVAPATDARAEGPLPGRTPSPETEGAMQHALRAAEQARRLAGADTETAIDTTEQSRKLAVLKAGPDKDTINPHGLRRPASPYQLMAGTVIAASLVSGLSSDLPGFVIAQVTETVFDSIAGRHLLIPQGARIVGKYDHVVAYGQQRALVVWQRIVFPDGTSIVIDNLPATDTSGYAGLSDSVDLHTWSLLKGIALATVLGVGNSLAFANTDSDILKALRETTGQTTNRAGQRLVEKNLNIQPTLTVRPGWPLRIIVHKDIVLRPYRNASAN